MGRRNRILSFQLLQQQSHSHNDSCSAAACARAHLHAVQRSIIIRKLPRHSERPFALAVACRRELGHEGTDVTHAAAQAVLLLRRWRLCVLRLPCFCKRRQPLKGNQQLHTHAECRESSTMHTCCIARSASESGTAGAAAAAMAAAALVKSENSCHCATTAAEAAADAACARSRSI